MARSALFFPAIQKAGKSLLSRTTVAFGERLSRCSCFDPCHRNKRVGNREHFSSTHSSPRLLRNRWDRQPVAGLRPTMTAGQSTQPGAVSSDDPAQSLRHFPRETLVRFSSLFPHEWRRWFRRRLARKQSPAENFGTFLAPPAAASSGRVPSQRGPVGGVKSAGCGECRDCVIHNRTEPILQEVSVHYCLLPTQLMREYKKVVVRPM